MASVPIVPIHKPDDMMLAIEVLRYRALSDGHATLAYLLEIAIGEAKLVTDQASRDAIERGMGSDDLWRPVSE